MARLRVDTVKMRECGNNIIEAADTYNTNVRSLLHFLFWLQVWAAVTAV